MNENDIFVFTMLLNLTKNLNFNSLINLYFRNHILLLHCNNVILFVLSIFLWRQLCIHAPRQLINLKLDCPSVLHSKATWDFTSGSRSVGLHGGTSACRCCRGPCQPRNGRVISFLYSRA